ncbi:hypothetical protein POV27_05565 [Aureisphaera galaxeae]|nr:hypothetical protein [Aureisphaera galaxeae]MDC8003508.1 hypothetical protein [Aureisphaera galaxeae]
MIILIVWLVGIGKQNVAFKKDLNEEPTAFKDTTVNKTNNDFS